MKNRGLTLLVLLLCLRLPPAAQFNENLEKEILALNENYQLDGIDRDEAFDRLEEIMPILEETEVKKYLSGSPWKYSHSVSSKGRKYRQSNAIYIYDLDERGNGFFTDKYSKKTYVTWDFERSNFLEIDRFKTYNRKERTRRDYLGIHSITNDRLVLTKVIKSKNYPGKSAVVFIVYFRR